MRRVKSLKLVWLVSGESQSKPLRTNIDRSIQHCFLWVNLFARYRTLYLTPENFFNLPKCWSCGNDYTISISIEPPMNYPASHITLTGSMATSHRHFMVISDCFQYLFLFFP